MMQKLSPFVKLNKKQRIPTNLNPIALRTVKTPQSFGRSECSRVKERKLIKMQRYSNGRLEYVFIL